MLANSYAVKKVKLGNKGAENKRFEPYKIRKFDSSAPLVQVLKFIYFARFSLFGARALYV